MAQSSLSSFLTAVTAIKPKTTDIASQLSKVAAGAIVAEIANQQQELNANGWTLKGNPDVDSVKVLSTSASANPATATVQACIDSSSVVTLDSDGKPLGTQTGSAARALNLYTFQYGAAGWRVVSRTFPDNPNC